MASKPTKQRKTPSRRTKKSTSTDISLPPTPETSALEGEFQPAVYDESLLERARTQWQFGDWGSLAKIQQKDFQHHPERSKLALFAASGHMQVGDMDIAQQLIQQAQDWGCDQQLLVRVLIAGVHNSLGCASALLGDQEKMPQHFEASLSTGSPNNDLRLLGPVRIHSQLEQLGLKTSSTTSLLTQHTESK